MGRKAKGVNKISDTYCIEYAQVVSWGLIHKERHKVEQLVEWRAEIILEAVCIESTYDYITDNNILKFNYFALGPGGIIVHRETIIKIEKISSNLGKGYVGYFICPITNQRCRKLYKTAKSQDWTCRRAFENQLYYPLQLCSKMQSYHKKYRAYGLWLDKYSEKRVLPSHKGNPTKKHLLIKRLKSKQAEMGSLALSPLAMPLSMRRLFPEALIEEFFRLYGKVCRKSDCVSQAVK